MLREEKEEQGFQMKHVNEGKEYEKVILKILISRRKFGVYVLKKVTR